MSHESRAGEAKISSKSSQSGSDDLHDRLELKLDELHADFLQLQSDVRAANQSSRRAHQDRIEGFKRSLRDILQAADRADREWQ
jgi:hypothetical protein